MANATFHLSDELLLTLRKLVPSRERSKFVEASVNRSLIAQKRGQLIKNRGEMKKIAEKYKMGTWKDTVQLIRRMRDTRYGHL